MAALAVAAVASFREIHDDIPNDLLRPAVLLANALVAAVLALGFARHEGSLKKWSGAHSCLWFGFWSAAVFRLVPPMLNEGDVVAGIAVFRAEERDTAREMPDNDGPSGESS